MENRVLFITGSRGDIGQAIRAIFEANNFKIIAPGSNEMDCSDISSISRYFSEKSITRIDALVHCAGINEPKEFNNITNSTFDRSLYINTTSFLYIIQALSDSFVDNKTKIVAVSSIYGSIARPRRLEYVTSKHALIGMVKSLALELAPKQILINTVSPGFIETSLTHKNNPPATIEAIKGNIPLNRLGDPSTIAEFIYFLCSEKNTYMTGQDIIIDGGYLIGGFQK